MNRFLILFLACWLYSWAVNAQCTSSAPPYSTNFSTFLPTCWDEASTGTPATGPSTLGSGDWAQSGTATRVNLYDTGTSDWLLTPEFDLSVSGSWEMVLNVDAVDFLSTTFSAMGSDDTIQVVISTDGGVTWAPLYTWDVNNPPTVTSTDIIIDLSTYTGASNLFGIWASEGATNDPEDYYFSINTLEVRMPITCAFPTTPISSNVTLNTVDIAWTENGTATQWQVEYGPAGFTPGTGTQMLASTNPVTVMNLMDGVAYELYVRAICGPADTSRWSTPVAFTTTCAVAIPTYNYDFTGYLGTCWSEAEGRLDVVSNLTYGTSTWDAGNYRNTGSNAAAKINIFGTSRDEWLISRSVDLTGGPFQLQFDVALTNWNNSALDSMGVDDTLAVVISTDNGVTWSSANTLAVYTKANEPSNGGGGVIIDLSAYTGVVKFGFYAASSVSNTDYDVHIDNFAVLPLQSCLAPTSVMTSNIASTSADVAWMENNFAVQWQLEYGPTGFTPGAGTQVLTAANPTTISNLMSDTDYDVYVRSICAPGDTSSWSSSSSFRTTCSAAIPTYNYDFTGYLGTCWSEAEGRLDVVSNLTYGTSTWSAGNYRNTGSNAAAKINIFGTSRDEWLISRSVDLTGGPFQLQFDVALTNWNNSALDSMGVDDSLAVVISTDNGVTWSSANALAVYTKANEPSNGGGGVIIDLSAYTGVVKFGFYAASSVSNTDYDVHIDNFAVLPLQSCLAPTNVMASNITTTSAEVAWMENNLAVQWQLEYGITGFTPGTGTQVVVTSNPTTISSLMSDTDYDVYVRSICAPGDTSLWSSAGVFTTLCGVSVPSYIYDFTGYLGNCWMESAGRLGTTLTPGTSTWREEGYRNVGTTGAAAINIFGTSVDEWLISTSIDLGTGATSYQVEFDIALTNWNSSALDSMGVDDTLAVVVSTDNGVTWDMANTLTTFTKGNEPSNAGDRITLDVSAYTGVVKFGFYAASSVSNTDYDIHIDSFAVNVLPQQFGNLVITEIMYNPPESGNDSLEFIEIFNNGTSAVDLSNMTLVTGTTYNFPSTILAANSYYVLAGNAAAFTNVYGAAPDDVFTGGLSNGGRLILLVDPTGNNVDSVDYDDSTPWPTGSAQGGPDEGGASLVLCDANTDNADGANWSASTTSIGVTINGKMMLASPGAANGCIAPVDVSVDTLLVDDVYCNVSTISGSFVVTNNSNADANNVVYTITSGGIVIGTGTITTLAANASDTIMVGPVPVVTGSGTIEASVSAIGDTDPNNDMLSKVIYVSNIDASIMTTATISCNGDTTGAMMASTTGAYGMSMYMWNNGAMTAAINNLAAGTYAVMATDSIGCMDSDTMVLTQPTLLVISGSATDVLCNGDSTGSVNIAATGGTAPYTFLWSDGTTTLDLLNVPAGTYTVTVTDANGCMAMETYTVNEPTALTLTMMNNMNGTATAMPAGGTAPYTYLWSVNANSQTTAMATGLMNGVTYMVTVTDDNGCTTMDSVNATFINVQTIDNVNSLAMFPNPTSGQVFVDLDLATTAAVQINITNALGQLVSQQALGNIQTQRAELSTKDLPDGLYLVQFQIGDEQITRKLIVRRK